MQRGRTAMTGAAVVFLSFSLAAQQTKPFTLQQVLSAPYASLLTPAPTGGLFAWTENAEGRHNLFVAGKDADGKDVSARQLTHNTADDGQDIAQLAWSPDAKYIAYTYGAPNGSDGKPANPAHLQRATPVTVTVQPVDGEAKPMVIGEGRAPLFAHDGSRLFYLRDGQIWVAELGERKQCLLPEGCPNAPADPATPVHQMVFDRGSASHLTLSPDGNTLAYLSRRREVNEPAHTLLALYDLTSHMLSFPAASTGDDMAPVFSPDGKSLAWLRAPFTQDGEFDNPHTGANPWSIQLLDLAQGSAHTAYAPLANKPGSVLPVPDGGEAYLLWTADGHIVFYSEADGWDHLYSLDPTGSAAPVLLTPGNFEVENAAMDATRRVLLYADNDPGSGAMDTDRRHVWTLDVVRNAADPVADTPTGPAPGATAQPVQRTFGTASETHPAMLDDGTLVALAASPQRPMHAVTLDTHGLAHDVQTYALPEGYPAGVLATAQQVVFASDAGLRIHVQLYVPQEPDASLAPPPDASLNTNSDVATDKTGAVKHPAIVFLHGGPHRQMLLGYPSMEYYSNAYAMNQYLVSRGFIVLSVNYRCGIGYGMEFRQCAHEGPTGGAEYDDVVAAAQYLRGRKDVDPKRIGLWGGSYGGYLTALALARNSDLFAAGVDYHGVHDWNLEDNAGDWKRGNNAGQDAIGKTALASSPLADLSKWTSPVLFIHGDNDPTVAYAQTPLLADALRARNATLPAEPQIDVEEMVLPDEVHEFLLHSDWLAAYTATAAFFERTLQPGKSLEPLK